MITTYKKALKHIKNLFILFAITQHLEPDSLSSQHGNSLLIARSHPGTRKLWRMSLTTTVLVGTLIASVILSACGSTNDKPDPTSQQADVPVALHKDTGWRNDTNTSTFVMFTEQAGWFISDHYYPGQVLHTTDGAKTWKQIKLPQEVSGKLVRTYAFDKDTLHIQPTFQDHNAVPMLHFYRSTDAGATWQRYNWPTTPKIEQDWYEPLTWGFLDTMHGWVVMPERISPREPAPVLFEHTLFRTDNGGKNWEKIAVLPFKYQVGNMSFLDAQTGWITAEIEEPQTDPTVSLQKVLYVTHDGGRSWNQQSLPVPPQGTKEPYSTAVPTFFSKQEGYLFASYTVQAGDSANQYLLKTQDGGESWQISGAALPETPGSYFFYGSWYIIDAEHVFNGLHMYTLMNGQWMKTSTLPAGSDEENTKLEFFTSQVGMAVVNNHMLYKTQDGGKTWQKVGTLPKA